MDAAAPTPVTCREVFPPRDDSLPRDSVGFLALQMSRDCMVEVRNCQSLASALHAAQNGVCGVLFLLNLDARAAASTFMHAVVKPLARRLHRGNCHCTDDPPSHPDPATKLLLRRRQPIVFMEAVVDTLSGVTAETTVEGVVRGGVTHVHPEDSLESATDVVLISSGTTSRDKPWRVVPLMQFLNDSHALDTLVSLITAAAQEPGLGTMDLSPFLDRERARVGAGGPAVPLLDVIFTRRDSEGEGRDATTLGARAAAQMKLARATDSDSAAGTVQECVARALASGLDALVLVTTEYFLAPLGALPLVPGVWDLAQLADAAARRVLQTDWEDLGRRIALLPWDFLDLPHLPKVCGLDLRDGRAYAYGDLAFLMDALDPAGGQGSPAAHPPMNLRPPHVSSVGAQWLAASVAYTSSDLPRTWATGYDVMAAAREWGWDEGAWRAKPRRGPVPPVDMSALQDVIITDGMDDGDGDDDDDDAGGTHHTLAYMRAAVAQLGLTDPGKPSQDQALGALAKRVLGYMVSRNLCANPYRYGFAYLVTAGGMVFGAALQTLTLVSHSDNDVRVFYHLTHNVTLTKVPTSCVLAPQTLKGLVPSRVRADGDGARYIDDVLHYHFGGAAAPSAMDPDSGPRVIAKPKVGRQLQWLFYQPPRVVDDAAATTTTTTFVALPCGSKRKKDLACEALGLQAGSAAEGIRVSLPTLSLQAAVPAVAFGSGGPVNVQSLAASTVLGLARYMGAHLTPEGNAARDRFARALQLTARGPTLADAVLLLHPPQLLVTANIEEELAAREEVQRLKATLETARTKWQALVQRRTTAEAAGTVVNQAAYDALAQLPAAEFAYADHDKPFQASP